MSSADNMTTKPCCPSTTPAVVTVDGVEDYELKGRWKIIDGLKTYVTGPADAKKGILVIYDIFGFFPQTLMGADLIASGVGGVEEEYRVFMPDFFEGEPADITWYPPETEEQGKNLMQWFSTRSPEAAGVKKIPAWLKAPEVEGIEEWGIVGYCWGGKAVSLICSEAIETKSTGMQGMRNKFKVAIQCHPGLIDPSDALEIMTPMLVLASMEEPVQDVTDYGENLRGEKRIEWFNSMVHGWMSARGDLGDVVVKGEYERGLFRAAALQTSLPPGPAFFWTFLYPLPKANTELQRQLTVTTSSQKKRKLSQQDAKSQDSNSSADIPRQSVEGRESQSPTDDIPRFDFPTPTPSDSALPPPIPTHLQTASSSLLPNEYTSSAASSPSALYAGLSIEGGEQSGSEFGTASFAASEDTRSQSPIRTFSHRAIMGGAADVPQRSSSPLKRPASDLEVDGKDDVDMITVPTSGLIEPSNTSKSSPLANRAQSVDMLGADEADVSNENTNLRRKSQEIPPIDHQIQTVTTIVEANEQVPIKDGDKLYLVSLRWLNRVKARGSAAKQNSKEEPEGEIGPIDNSDIIQQIGKDSDGKDYVQLKPGISSESFLAVPEDAWDLIVSWYGLMPGSIPIVRTAHNTNPDKWALPNVIYEWHPLVIVVHRLWSHNNPLALPADLKRLDPPAPIFVLSRTTKYHDFLKLIKTKAAIDLTRKVRVWRVPRIQPASESVAPVGSAATPPSSRPASPAAENISASTSKAPQDSWTKLLLDVESFTKLESGVEREKLDLADNTNNKNYNGNMDLATAGLGEDQTIVLDEFVSQDMYVCNYIPKQDKSASIVVTKSGKKANNQTNSGRNSPAPIGPVTRGRTQRSGKTVGCVGLSNLGNTCYMNSALQCVRSVEELTKYFLSKTSEEELNTDNPLGNNGEVAIVYGQLLQEMYKDPVPGSIAPRYFKNTIGKYAPSFSGYGQQDSQEFLGFLLDGLQEDLSRVKKKPYIEKPDSTDEMVNNEELIREMAAKVWDITKKRDDSVIADLFTGMYKSTLVCPECNKVSITFDPFNNLTLQLPIENIWRHDIIYFPLSDSPIRISVDLDKNGSIKALKQFVSERVNVPVERLFCAENWKEKFYKVHDDMKCASEEIGQSDNCNVYELEAVPTNWPAPKKQPKKGKTKTIYSSNLDSSDDDVPNWDSPLAERMIVPVYHRAINNDRGRNNRTKAHKWTLAPHVITLTPQEARSEDMVRRKILEKVATFTTYSFVTNDTDSSSPESASESVDPDLVVTTGSDADSAGDGKVVAHSIDGEDGLVDVSMKNSTNAPESSDVNDKKAVAQTPKSVEHKFNTRRPPYLDPKVFLEPEVQNMFDLSYYTGVNELVPLGWQSVQEEKTYPLLSSRNPQLQQPIHEADDYDMTNGRGSETSDDDTLSSNNAISNTRTTEESDDSEDELAKNFNRPLPDRPKAPRSGFKVGFGNKRRSRLKTYSKKGNKPPPKLPHSEAFDQDAPDDGPLVRLGEGIIVDWKQNAFETIFCADDPQDTLRGQSKLEAVNIPLLPDENLEVKRKTRLARRKNGITLDDCLDEFGKEEILSEQDTWYCPRCKEHRRASKKFELWKIPDILVMHLKRFSSSGIRRDKLDVLVDFPIEGLDLSSRVIEHEDGKSEIYDLFAVDDHWGGLGGGHYTAFAKNFNDDQWYEYNDSSVSKVADPQRVVSPSAYLLFYRRRSEVPLGGPRLKAIVESFDSPNDSSDDETSDSGEGQGLVGNSSLHGSSRALTGAGAVHPQQNPGSSGKEMTTINPQDLDELPPYENQDLNDGMQLQNSIEEDEGISMNDNTITAFTANWSGWSTMPGLGTDNPERPSGAGSDMDVQSDGDFSNRSDIVQDNSSCGSAVRAGRVIDFEDTPAVDDNGDNWVDQSLVPDIDDGRVDMYDFQHTLQLSKHSVPLQQFNVPAAGPEIEEEVDEPATDIHVEEGEGLKIE